MAIKKRTVFIFLSLVGLLVYANSFTVPFHYDDLSYLKRNPTIQSFATTGGQGAIHSSSIFSGGPEFLTVTLNYTLGGHDPFSYHVLNLLIHIVNAFLLYLLFYNHAGNGKSEGYSSKYVLAAVLFLIHPLNTESVTSLSGRSWELEAFFVLSSMNCFFKATNKRFYSGWYVASIVFFLLGVETNGAAIVLPAFLVLFDYFFNSKNKEDLFLRSRSYLPYLLLLGGLCILQVFYIPPPSLEIARTWTTQILTEIKVLPEFVRLLVFPFWLNIDHDMRPSLFMDSGVVFSLLMLIALISTAAFLRKKVPIVSFSILWFFVAMFPFFTVRLDDFMAERWAYTASLGFSVGLAELLFLALNRYNQAGIALIGFVVIVSGTLTVVRNHQYASPVLLWSDAATKSPDKYRPSINLSNAYRESGNLGRAIESAQAGIGKGKARGLTDREMTAEYINLAAALEEMGDVAQAEAVLRSRRALCVGSLRLLCDPGLTLRAFGKV